MLPFPLLLLFKHVILPKVLCKLYLKYSLEIQENIPEHVKV